MAACSARRLLASRCVLGLCLAPGWHQETGRYLPAFRRGIAKVPGTRFAPGKWTRFASIPTQGPQLVPGTGLTAAGTATGAWHQVGSRI
jgi:hypothetical protein